MTKSQRYRPRHFVAGDYSQHAAQGVNPDAQRIIKNSKLAIEVSEVLSQGIDNIPEHQIIWLNFSCPQWRSLVPVEAF
jgi:hypothetical protein